MRFDRRLVIGVALLALVSFLSCSSTTGAVSVDGDVIRTSGIVRFEVYDGAVCGDAGPSPVSLCSRSTYTGGLAGNGHTAIQRREPLTPDGVFFVAEIEVLRLPDGELRSVVNAVFHSKSPDVEVVSLHTVTGGTGRYAGASGHIRLWGVAGEPFEYVAVIRPKPASSVP